MALSTSERNAYSKAIHTDAAARVVRLGYGTYQMVSAAGDALYTIRGTDTFSCDCPAGRTGRHRYHVAAVQLRRTQEDAKRQARQLAARRAQPAPAQPAPAQPAPASPAPAPTTQSAQPVVHTSTVTLRIGGLEVQGTGATRLQALANAKAA